MNETSPQSSADEMSFEQAVQRLEAIVADLEDDKLDLAASLEAYEEGVALARQCLKRLDQAELQVQELRLDDDGNGTGR